MTYAPRDWPTLMDLQTAADYLALAPGSLAGFLSRQGVTPVALGVRLRRWRRCDLDAVVDRLPLRQVAHAAPCRDEEIGVEWAIAAVERRAQLSRRRRREQP